VDTEHWAAILYAEKFAPLSCPIQFLTFLFPSMKVSVAIASIARRALLIIHLIIGNKCQREAGARAVLAKTIERGN